MINFQKLDNTSQGIILLVLGVILLLYTLNVFTRWFNIILVLCGLAMVLIGSLKLDLPSRLKKMIRK